MSIFPTLPGTACLRAGLRADAAAARLRLAAGLEALILVLFARLFARVEAAWHESPDNTGNQHDGCAPTTPTMGRAPHAAAVEAGLVPDWVLSGIRNRGLRPGAVPERPRPRARPARAPPAARVPVRRPTPNRGASTRGHFYY